MRLFHVCLLWLLSVCCYAQPAPGLRHNGLNYTCADTTRTTGTLAAGGRNGYAALQQMLGQFSRQINTVGFKDVVVATRNPDTANETLVMRLQQLGIIEPGAMPRGAALYRYIKDAQRLFDLEEDGVAGKATLAALNVPLHIRIKELETALATLEWLSCGINRNNVIVVNIPSAGLTLFEGGKVALYSRIICGKPATPTSTLCAPVTEVILYPYWNVPYNIATRELLPAIKRNRSYLDANNLQVVSKSGKVLDPHSINWRSLHAGNFPYLLRQSTGCDNSLGIVKLNFYNPFTIYMHDTPAKSLFGRRKRFFSHGCMRVEKAMELARHMLTDTNRLDEIVAQGCLKYQSPVHLPTGVKTSVFVLYNTAWADSTGAVHFYGDIYNRLPEVP